MANKDFEKKTTKKIYTVNGTEPKALPRTIKVLLYFITFARVFVFRYDAELGELTEIIK